MLQSLELTLISVGPPLEGPFIIKSGCCGAVNDEEDIGNELLTVDIELCRGEEGMRLPAG